MAEEDLKARIPKEPTEACESKAETQHCGVNDLTTFVGWATSGGTKLDRVNFSPHQFNPKDVLVTKRDTIVILAMSKVPVSIPTMPLVHHEVKVVGSFQRGRLDVRRQEETASP